MSNENQNEHYDTYSFVVGEEHAGQRADKVISALCAELSRTRIQALIKEGNILVNHEPFANASEKLAAGDSILIDVPPAVEGTPQAENIPLNIVYEDDDLLVINKPAGLVVHPGAGNQSGTLVNALLYHCGDTLSGIGGVVRPGIVHRLDKDTSGLMVVAKNDHAHHGLSAQLSDRSLSREYLALVLHVPMPPRGRIDQPIGRHTSHRLKMAVNKDGRDAVTNYRVLENFSGACALVECALETGRTHQIRVHMSYVGHPLLGDPLYGPQPTAVRAALKKAGYDEAVIESAVNFPRQALHAARLSFLHPGLEEEMEFEAELPEDFSKLLKILEK